MGSQRVGHNLVPEQQQQFYIEPFEPPVIHLGLPGGSVVKIPLPMQEMQVQSLGLEDPLEKEMATHSSILAWETPWTEDPGGLQFLWSQKSQTHLSDETTTDKESKVSNS